MRVHMALEARLGARLSGAILAGALLAQTSAAPAAEYVITYTGTVSNSFDATGEFGQAGQTLDGLTFTARYTLTVPTPGALIATDGATFAEIYGGYFYGAASPLSGAITIARDHAERGGYASRRNLSMEQSLGRPRQCRTSTRRQRRCQQSGQNLEQCNTKRGHQHRDVDRLHAAARLYDDR